MNLTFKIVKPIFISKIFLFLFLYLHLVGLNPIPEINYGTDLSETGVGNIVRQLLFITIFLGSMRFFFDKKNTVKHFYNENKVLFLLVFLIFTSALWSNEPGTTIRRSVLLFIVCFLPIMLAMKIGFNNFARVNATILCFFIIVSFLSCFLIPGAIHQGEVLDESLNGSWRGIFGHKNNSAVIAAISAYLFFYMYIEEKGKNWFCAFLIAVFFLLFTQSKTTITLFFPILFLAYFLSRHGSIKYSIIFILVISLFIPLSFIFGYHEFNNYFIDNPELFTGRAAIWQVMFEAISDNPILGFGYGSVWSAGEFSAISEYGVNTSAWVGAVSHGHNGYLDLWISCGIFALVFLIILLIKSYKDICFSTNYSHNQKFLSLSIFLLLVFHNFLESSFAVYSSPAWYFFIFAYCVKFQKVKI